MTLEEHNTTCKLILMFHPREREGGGGGSNKMMGYEETRDDRGMGVTSDDGGLGG